MNLQDGLSQPQRGRAVLVIVSGIAMAVMDGSIVNLALPGIARELSAPASQAIWVVNAYQIASLVMLLPLPRWATVWATGVSTWWACCCSCCRRCWPCWPTRC